MATWTLNKNATGSSVGAGPPSKTGRLSPYMEVQKVDFSKLNGTTGVSQGDLVSVFQIPTWSTCTMVLAELKTVLTRTTGTSSPNILVTVSLNAVKWVSQVQVGQALAATPLKMKALVKTSIFRKAQFVSNDTTKQVTLNVRTLSSKCAAGVINVYAYITPMAGVNI